MRIDRIELRNFKKFAQATFEFPRPVNGPADAGSFHVLIGENGTGKTSILDAVAVALGVWLERVPDSLLANSRRRLTKNEKRLTATQQGDRMQFQRVLDTMSVLATGTILDRVGVSWGQSLPVGKTNVSNAVSKEVMTLIWSAYERIGRGEQVLLPVICYYGAGRAWLAHNERNKAKAKSNGPANRWEAFYDCLNERIRVADLAHWFQGEHIAMGNRQGRYRPGFEVVRRAVLACVPGADGIWYDSDSEEIALSISGNPQPFGNLSAGQRVMLALVADLAIRMVTQNNFLVPANVLGPEDEPLPRVLAQTPGVVLIDELDVHLHPKWQLLKLRFFDVCGLKGGLPPFCGFGQNSGEEADHSPTAEEGASRADHAGCTPTVQVVSQARLPEAASPTVGSSLRDRLPHASGQDVSLPCCRHCSNRCEASRSGQSIPGTPLLAAMRSPRPIACSTA